MAALFIEMLQTIYQKEDVEGYEEGYLDRFVESKEDWIIVAEENEEVVAFLSIEVHHEPKDYIYLDDFSVTMLMNCSGYGKFGHVNDYEYDVYLNMINLNCSALTSLCRITIPYMKNTLT